MSARLKFLTLGLLTSLMMLGVYFLGYVFPRTDFQATLSFYILLFGLMAVIFTLSRDHQPWIFIFLSGLAIRLTLLFAVPQWSEDYARFLWDGELLRLQENPYAETPRDFYANHSSESSLMLEELFPLMNSPEYYSVYPPLNQVIFWLATTTSGGTVAYGILSLRLLLLMVEIGVFVLLLRIFTALAISLRMLCLYWLNPFVILEITGNLHFEGLVLLFLLSLGVSMSKKKWLLSGAFFGMAIGMKLLPLILLPTFVAFRETRKNYSFWAGTLITLLLSFAWLLIDSSWINFLKSLSLYQGIFEFNSSVYYVLREIGYMLTGYNTIAVLSKLLSIATLSLIIYFSWRRRPKNLQEMLDLWVLVYLIYLVLQPVVHPWYLIPAFGLSLITGRVTFLIWSFAVIFSYEAYGVVMVEESPLILLLEYLLVVGGIYLDYFSRRSKLSPSHEITA